MLSWFWRLFERPQQAAPAPEPSRPDVRVTFDDGSIRVMDRAGLVQEIRWAALTAVEIKATLAGPEKIDLAWVLMGRDGRAAVVLPLGARGEPDFIRSMQRRLAGFDNMAVVEAMSSAEAAEFQIWPAATKLGLS